MKLKIKQMLVTVEWTQNELENRLLDIIQMKNRGTKRWKIQKCS